VRRVLALWAALAVASNDARADEEPPRPAPAPAPRTAPAPRPDQASGVERDDAPSMRRRLLWIPRAILFLPRWVVWGVGQPIRIGAYAFERYAVSKQWHDTFYTDGGGFGLYPVASYETGFGFTAGGRLVWTDALGHGERVKARAQFGGRFRQSYNLNIQSGQRLSRALLELDSIYEQRPNERTWGVGNDADMELEFREDLMRTVGVVQIPLIGALSTRVATSMKFHDLPVADVKNARAEAAIVYDSRRPTSPFASRVIDGTGWLIAANAGITRGLGDDPSKFTSYGAEVQRHIDLYRGTRVLALRALIDVVDGDQISFIDLPRLGGTELLRGYPANRFRDRSLALATVEYTWDVGNFCAAYLFFDIGRVYPSLGDFTFEGMREGYGGGIQLHSTTDYIGRFQVAASSEGVIFEVVLAPAFRRRESVWRY
jgi:hypothetical protein